MQFFPCTARQPWEVVGLHFGEVASYAVPFVPIVGLMGSRWFLFCLRKRVYCCISDLSIV